ncbi:helix-turn-helix domain-containing protein [Nocardiopsis dassonvillei]|uniref:helix-turn-helix domain-containing protein n=1 Tax=Nocardiopsis dassonvillei TaxID=2014 RepID=UPI00200E87CF|nr:helix-turn-helix domain-containing protein [Nocardiopsis dassonvillei]MCK9869514.1 helix-turn-helix domain-containing protein [Nocardiopsis dassonvillei]
MLTGFRYRLALTDEQAESCQVYGDICRAVWNTGLHQRREAVRQVRAQGACGRERGPEHSHARMD